MAETLRLQFDEPEEIALRFATGREVEGRFGPQMMYSLVDGRVIYLELHVAERITEMRIQPGERFTILKREKKDGRKKGCEYIIQRVDAPGTGEPIQAAPPATPAASSPRHLQTGSNNHNANGVAARAQENTLSDFIAYHTTLLSGFLCASVDALDNAARYASSKGRKLEFNEEDIRTLASTLYIQAAKGGAQQWAR